MSEFSFDHYSSMLRRSAVPVSSYSSLENALNLDSQRPPTHSGTPLRAWRPPQRPLLLSALSVPTPHRRTDVTRYGPSTKILSGPIDSSIPWQEEILFFPNPPSSALGGVSMAEIFYHSHGLDNALDPIIIDERLDLYVKLPGADFRLYEILPSERRTRLQLAIAIVRAYKHYLEHCQTTNGVQLYVDFWQLRLLRIGRRALGHSTWFAHVEEVQ